jgi:XTP/dITP diphosphohydrolase
MLDPNSPAPLIQSYSILLATHNKGKIREIEAMLAPFNISLLNTESHTLPEPEETGSTFEENALIKAMATHELYPETLVVADDSGLVIPALNGNPGIYSARWAGPHKDFTVAIKRIEEELSPIKETPAFFVCALGIVFPGGKSHTLRGECHGRVIFPPRGGNTMGYDPIFIKNGMDKTLGEISGEEKNMISHRYEAIKQLAAYLNC